MPQFSDQEIMSALLNHYTNQGLDSAAMMNDLTFNKMPIRERIRFIQENANPLATSVSTSLAPHENRFMRTRALISAIEGGVAGAAVARTLGAKSATLGALIGASMLGTASATATYKDLRNRIKARVELQNALARAAEEPSLQNAVSALATQNTHQTSNKDLQSMYSDLYRKMVDRTSAGIEPRVRNAYQSISES